jgi:hypothetical protein
MLPDNIMLYDNMCSDNILLSADNVLLAETCYLIK